MLIATSYKIHILSISFSVFPNLPTLNQPVVASGLSGRPLLGMSPDSKSSGFRGNFLQIPGLNPVNPGGMDMDGKPGLPQSGGLVCGIFLGVMSTFNTKHVPICSSEFQKKHPRFRNVRSYHII